MAVVTPLGVVHRSALDQSVGTTIPRLSRAGKPRSRSTKETSPCPCTQAPGGAWLSTLSGMRNMVRGAAAASAPVSSGCVPQTASHSPARGSVDAVVASHPDTSIVPCCAIGAGRTPTLAQPSSIQDAKTLTSKHHARLFPRGLPQAPIARAYR